MYRINVPSELYLSTLYTSLNSRNRAIIRHLIISIGIQRWEETVFKNRGKGKKYTSYDDAKRVKSEYGYKKKLLQEKDSSMTNFYYSLMDKTNFHFKKINGALQLYKGIQTESERFVPIIKTLFPSVAEIGKNLSNEELLQLPKPIRTLLENYRTTK